jgi:hypothetical protein
MCGRKTTPKVFAFGRHNPFDFVLRESRPLGSRIALTG